MVRPCTGFRQDVSAWVDGELGSGATQHLAEHLEGCRACSAFRSNILSIRAATRVRPADNPPDLTERIVERVLDEGRRTRKRDAWVVRVRLATVGAVAAASLLLATTVPWRDSGTDIARASEISSAVRKAARSLAGFQATYSIVERRWHPLVPTRRFEAELSFATPEKLRLDVRDLTTYPTVKWPHNDVSLVATPERWWISEPSSCPIDSLPSCGIRVTQEERSVVDRQPFDGSRSPTDLIVPLETVASAGAFEVLGRDMVAGRDAYHLVLTYAEAAPVVASLQPGGIWRHFDPLDRADLWIDAGSWVPLALDVTPAGELLPGLSIKAQAVSESVPADTSFRVPSAPHPATGRFHETGSSTLDVPAPASVGNLGPYRFGRAGAATILSYADGATWLKVTYLRPAAAALGVGEPVMLDNGNPALYLPADTSLRRTVEIYGADMQVRLESNLSRAALLTVAGSIETVALAPPAPAGMSNATEGDVTKIAFAGLPGYLPDGYRFSSALIGRDRATTTVLMHYRRAEIDLDARGITITQTDGLDRLPPASFEFTTIRIGNTVGRWLAERGELEWISDGIYRSVVVPNADLATAAAIAEALR